MSEDATSPQEPHEPASRYAPLGPNPFPEDDPRHDRFLEVSRTVREKYARWHADLLRRIASTPNEQMHTMYLRMAVERFDLDSAFFIPAVTTYEEAELCEEVLPKLSTAVYELLSRSLDSDPPPFLRSVSKSDLLGDLKLKLNQRVAHWTAEALRHAREAAEAARLKRDESPEQSPAAETTRVSSATSLDSSAQPTLAEDEQQGAGIDPPAEVLQDTSKPDLRTATSEERRTAVATFLSHVNTYLSRAEPASPVRIEPKHLWHQYMGYRTNRQFQYWLAAESGKNGSHRCHEKVRSLLAMKPADFVQALRDKGPISQK